MLKCKWHNPKMEHDKKPDEIWMHFKFSEILYPNNIHIEFHLHCITQFCIFIIMKTYNLRWCSNINIANFFYSPTQCFIYNISYMIKNTEKMNYIMVKEFYAICHEVRNLNNSIITWCKYKTISIFILLCDANIINRR